MVINIKKNEIPCINLFQECYNAMWQEWSGYYKSWNQRGEFKTQWDISLYKFYDVKLTPSPSLPHHRKWQIHLSVAPANPTLGWYIFFCHSCNQLNQKILLFLLSKSVVSPATSYHFHHNLLPSFWYIPQSCFTRKLAITSSSLVFVFTPYGVCSAHQPEWSC